MGRKQRELLAYVELENGDVLVDIIKLTRNGYSYYFQGKRWMRNLHCLGGDDCTSDNGEKKNIAILNRRYVPEWVDINRLRVSENAKEQYEWWLARQY